MFFETAPGFGTFLRRLWQQKPEQYDFDWAQYSVMVNAESIGIDPASIVGYWPFWAGAGGTAWDVSPRGLLDGSLSNTLWTSQGLAFNGSNSRVDTDFVGNQYPFCAFLDVVPVDGSEFSNKILSYANSSVSDQQHRLDHDTSIEGINVSCYDGSLYKSGSISVTPGSLYSVVACWPSNSRRFVYVDGIKSTEGTDTVSISNIDRITFGTSADSTPYGFIEGDARYVLALQLEPWADLVELFRGHPYYLLQPRPRQLFFDYGAGGTTVTQSVAGSLGNLSGALGETVTFTQALQGSI